MIISHIKDNHLYLAFQDFEDKIDEIYKELNNFPFKASKQIKKILDNNFFNNTLERQTKYINSISTYIDDIGEDEKQYFFHLYILPKDLNINFEMGITKDQKIIQVEQLSLKLFKLYGKLNSDEKLLKLFNHKEGTSFLQLESQFYIEKLEKVYGILLNYKSSYKNKIICSDKLMGIEIAELNLVEKNPLKNYQFIKSPYQKDLIKFIYTTILFLKEHRLKIFKDTNLLDYKLLMRLINKINNLLLKISRHKNLIQDKIEKDTLDKYFKLYKNNKELKENRKLFKTIKSIFFMQLKSDVQFFVSIDLTKVFEKIVENKLANYSSNLFIGKESEKCIVKFLDQAKEIALNSTNHLLNTCNHKIKQYPDFLIKDTINNTTIYHIIDAKYKLKENVLNNANDIRQILIYSILFNKEYSNILANQKNIKKIIIYVKKSEIDMNSINNLELNINIIDIFSFNINNLVCKDNLYDSDIIFIPIVTLKHF